MNLLNYQVSGKRTQSTGKTMVLLGGYTASLQVWNPLLKEFEKRKIIPNTLAIDNLGAGDSPKPDELYTTSRMAEAVCGCLHNLGITDAIVIGHSMGGAIAQQIALHCPKRVGHLVLLSTFAKLDVVATQFLMSACNLLEHGVDREDVAKSSLPSLFGGRFLSHAENVEMAINRFVTNPQTVPGMRGQLNACITHDTLDELGNIECDTTIMVGTQDILVHPKHSETLYRAIPRATLVKFKGYGHMIQLECPDKLCDHIVGLL